MEYVEEKSFGIIPLIQKGGVWEVLLILHQGGRHWAFPKGRGHEGESPKESAKRELQEETGLEVERFLQEVPLIEQYQFHRKGEAVIKTVHYFPATVQGKLKLQAEEIQDAKWVPLKDGAAHLTFKEARSMCRELIKILNV